MSQVTVTGKVGGGQTMTTKVYTNPKQVTFNNDRALLTILQSDDTIANIDISGDSTVMATLASGILTALTVSA